MGGKLPVHEGIRARKCCTVQHSHQMVLPVPVSAAPRPVRTKIFNNSRILGADYGTGQAGSSLPFQWPFQCLRALESCLQAVQVSSFPACDIDSITVEKWINFITLKRWHRAKRCWTGHWSFCCLQVTLAVPWQQTLWPCCHRHEEPRNSSVTHAVKLKKSQWKKERDKGVCGNLSVMLPVSLSA